MEPNAKGVVTAANAGDEVLGCFWKLSSANEGDRAAATRKLFELISQSQKDFEAVQENKNCGSECSPLTVYVVERLVAGLGSGRRPSHIGFSAALVTLLKFAKCVNVNVVWSVMEEKIKLSGAMRGEQFRDAAIGRVLCCSALIQSGALASDEVMTMEVGRELTAIYNRKAAMREMCSALIIDLLDCLETPRAQSTLQNWPELHALLHEDPEDADPEALCLSLILMPLLPEGIRKGCKLLPSGMRTLPSKWQLLKGPSKEVVSAAHTFFTTEHLAKLEDCLKRSSHCHPMMHSVWRPILNLLIPGNNLFGKPDSTVKLVEKSQQSQEPLAKFWCKFLIPVLLGSIEERQFLVHRILQIILPHIPCPQLHILLGDDFVRRIARQSQSSEDAMHLSAVECVKAINQHLKKNGGSLLNGSNILMLRRLVKYNPFKDVCQYILLNVEKHEINGQIASLLTQFSHAENAPRKLVGSLEDDEEEATAGNEAHSPRGASRGELLRELEKASKDVEWNFGDSLEVAQFLVVNGIFEIESENKYVNSVLERAKRFNHQLSSDVRGLCCQCLISILPMMQWAISKSGVKEEMLLKMINQFIIDSLDCDGVELVVALTPEDDKCTTVLSEVTSHLHDIISICREQEKNGALREKQILSMLQLCGTLSLYHWLAPESVEMELVNEIPGIVVGAFGGRIEEVSASDSDIDVESTADGFEANEEINGASKATSGEEMAVVSHSDHYTDSLVDLILSINTRSTHPLKPKSIRDQVYFVCCSFASEITVRGWLEVFAAMKQSFQSRGPKSGSAEEESDIDSSEAADESNDEMDIAENDNRSESGLAAKNRGAGPKHQEATEASESDDESGPDDEAMFRMDAALAAVFRSKKDQKHREKDAAVSFITSTLSYVKHLVKYEQMNPATVFGAAELVYLLHQIKEREGFGYVIKIAEATAKLALKCRPCNLPELAPLVEERAIACLRFSAKDNIDKPLRRMAGQALKLMVRWLLKADRESGVRVLQTIVSSFFGTGKSKLEFLTVNELILETQPLCLGVLPTLINFALHARTSFLQLQAMRLMCLSLNSKEQDSVQSIMKHSLLPLHDYLVYVVGLPFTERSKNIVALSEAIKIVKCMKRIFNEGQSILNLVNEDSIMIKIRSEIKEVPPVKVQAKLKALEAALKQEPRSSTGCKNVEVPLKISSQSEAINRNKKVVKTHKSKRKQR